jgi:hypothetical protein
MKYSMRNSVPAARADLMPLSDKGQAARSLWPGKRIRIFLSSLDADTVAEKWNNEKKAAASRIKPNFQMNLKLELNRCWGRTIIMISKMKFYKSNQSAKILWFWHKKYIG